MVDVGSPTFDQLRVFLSVVEEGSFVAAARRLNRATSAVTYAIDNLENQLCVALFDRGVTRRPTLTQAGRAVVVEAKSLDHGMRSLRAKVAGLAQGLEAEIAFAVDVMFPTSRLVKIFRELQDNFPTVTIRLHVEALGEITQLVLSGRVNIAICGPLTFRSDELEEIAIAGIEMVPVAAPTHPLANASGLAAGEARNHLQLVLSDRSKLTEGRDFGVVGLKTWRLGDLGAKHALLRAGVGWGAMPVHAVEEELRQGKLVRLTIPEWPVRHYGMRMIHRIDTPPGPATRWLIERFSSDVDEKNMGLELQSPLPVF